MAKKCECLCHKNKKPSINLTFKNKIVAVAPNYKIPIRSNPIELQILSTTFPHIYIVPVNQSVAITAFKSLEVRIMNLPNTHVAATSIGTMTDMTGSVPPSHTPGPLEPVPVSNTHRFNSTFRSERQCSFPGCSFTSSILRTIIKHQKSHFFTLNRSSLRPIRFRSNVSQPNHIRSNCLRFRN